MVQTQSHLWDQLSLSRWEKQKAALKDLCALCPLLDMCMHCGFHATFSSSFKVVLTAGFHLQAYNTTVIYFDGGRTGTEISGISRRLIFPLSSFCILNVDSYGTFLCIIISIILFPWPSALVVTGIQSHTSPRLYSSTACTPFSMLLKLQCLVL